jgi:hypothetical protein
MFQRESHPSMNGMCISALSKANPFRSSTFRMLSFNPAEHGALLHLEEGRDGDLTEGESRAVAEINANETGSWHKALLQRVDADLACLRNIGVEDFRDHGT